VISRSPWGKPSKLIYGYILVAFTVIGLSVSLVRPCFQMLKLIHLGTGGRGRHWLDRCRRPDVETVACVDVDQQRWMPCQKTGCKTFLSLEEALCRNCCRRRLAAVHRICTARMPGRSWRPDSR
jgi:hypothetical protein